jgi:signal transduction histidine kinase
MAAASTTKEIFQPRARMLLLLGDQLIRDPSLAVFELVKNAYDADASICTVTINNLPSKDATIVIEDDGLGMSRDIITGVWLEPGTEYRAEQRIARKRSKKYHRFPLGEKGVGRFAVHKLGARIELVTRARDGNEVAVSIDWRDFAGKKYLKDVPVTVVDRPPKCFIGRNTGTRITVRELWAPESWTRGRIRDLSRSITSICSPFNTPDDFLAELMLSPDEGWLSGLLSMDEVLQQSLFIATGVIDNRELKYRYEFRPTEKMKGQVEARRVTRTAKLLRTDPKEEPLDLSEHRIGPIRFDFHVFDRDPSVLELTTSDKAGLKAFLDANGGIRVYRDGIRVYDFGEQGNDWLDLGGRRVNIPTVRVSNNQIIGAVTLNASKSEDLIEKTNREGFIQNDTYEAFRQSVLFALMQVEAERHIDKDRLRKQYTKKRIKEPVLDEIAELREKIKERKLDRDLGSYVDRIESQFQQVRDTLLTAAGSGLTLTTVIHEVEKIIKELSRAVNSHASRERIQALVKHLDTMVDGLAYLARKSGTTREKASSLIHQAIFNTEYRLRAHRIHVVNGLDEGEADFAVKCTRRLVLATLMNLIDNSIHWLENRGSKDKQLYIGPSRDYDGKPSIIVADNGPGFSDPPEYLVRPFFSRRPGGMGLGLHLANEVAKLHNGRLIFPDSDEVSLPQRYTGAIVGIEFPEG